MALDDLTTPLPEEDYSDFTKPTNLLRVPEWVASAPEARASLVDPAMTAFLGDLEAKRDLKVDAFNAKGEPIQANVWSPAGTLTPHGQEFINKTRQLLQTAAQDPDGGIYLDDESGRWETSHWVSEFGKGPKQKAFDPLHDFNDWRKESSAIDTDTNKAAATWEQFVEHSNAGIKDEAAKIDPANKELKKEWARRMAISDFNPESLGEQVFGKVGGQMMINPKAAFQMDRAESEIEAMDIGEADKKLLRLQHREFIEKNAPLGVNAFAAADAGVLGSIVGRPLNDEFNEAMSKPGASAYEFIKANKERFNKDNYGVGQEIAETFRDAIMATGTAALWIGSGGQLTSPMEAWGGLAADSAKAYNNGKAFSIGGIDINRRDLTELTGQIGSFVAMGGMGSLAGRGLAKAGASGASRFAVGAEGQLISRAGQAAAAEQAAIAAGTNIPKTLGQKAVSLAKTIGTDSEVILGSLQASGTSYGKTFNDTFERTGNREQAHKEATITGVADGLSAFIATSVMNRFSRGAGKLLDGGENVGGGAVQNIRSRFQGSKGLKEVQEMLGKVAGLESKELRKVVGAGIAQEMNAASKKLGLRGWGVGGDALAEGIEESMDEVISGAIQSMSHDSKSWTEAEWEQIQNNWQGYVKAGILGAIGGTSGALQGAALSPKQTFGKSDALQVQQGMWDKIKSNVEKFDLPNMPAMIGTGDPKSVAEYLASDASIEEKSNVLIASARANNLASFANAFSASTPSAAPDAVSGAESQPITPSASETPSGAESAPAKGSLGELMTGMKIPLNDGRQWDDLEVSDDKNTYEIPGVGKATLVKANTRNEDGSSTPFNVGVRIVDKDGNSNVLSAEQAASVIPDSGSGSTIRKALRNADSGTLQTLFSTKIETPNEATATGQGETKAPADESGSTAPSNENAGTPTADTGTSDSKPSVNAAAEVNPTAEKSSVVESDVSSAKTPKAEIGRTDMNPQDGSVTVETTSKTTGKKYLITSELRNGKTRWVISNEDAKNPGEYSGGIPMEPDKLRATAIEALGEDFVNSVEAAHKEADTGGFAGAESAEAKIKASLAGLKSPSNETKPAKSLNPAGEIKADIQSDSLTKDEQDIAEDSLTKDEAGDAKVVSSNIANHEVSVAPAPKVAQQSVKGTGQVSRTHKAELDSEGAETGLYVDRSGKAVVTPALFRKVLAENDGKAKRTAKALSERIAKLKAKPERGFIPINALPVNQKKDAADTLLDPDKRLVVGSDTIENGETDSAGGSWERVVVGKKEGGESPMGAKVFYTYTQPKGSGAPLNQGDIVLINGDSENVLILDNVSNGKWAFRKVSIKPDTMKMNFKSTTLKEKNFVWNRSRLTGVAKQVKPHLAEIVNGTITPADFERLMNEVVKVVAPDFKGTLKKVDFSKDSEEYLQAHPGQDEIWVDYKNLRREFNVLYRAMNLSNDTGNEILSLDVARVMAKMFDEEVIHLLAGKEFKNKELEKWYDEIFGERDEDDAPMGSDHPFRELLLKTAKERFPHLDPESLAIDKHDNAKVVIAHELLRKLQQIRTSGSFTEQATDESQRLQAAMTLDYRDAPGGDAKLAKMMRTVRDMVKRYSDRIRNILWLRWNQGRLPMHQQMLLNRMDAAYKRAGVNGDTEFARDNADEQVVSMSDEYEESFRQWANQIGARHYEAQASLRTLAETYANSDYEDLLVVDRETLGMTLAPEVREELAVSDPEALQRIDAMLAEFNDEKPSDGKLVPDNPSLERAKTLMFLRKNVLDSKMALLDFDVTPALDVTSKNGSDVLMRVAELIKNSSPEAEHAEQFRRLGLMATDRSNAIQRKIAYIREVAMKKRIAAIRSLDVDTLKGRLAIVKQAEKLGLDNPFNEESATEQDVSPVMQELKDSMIQRVRELAENEVFQVPSEDGPESTTLAELDAQMQQEIAVAQMAEKAFLSAPQGNGEPSQFTRFIEFKRALDAYNRSVTNVKRHALGDFWRKPTRFGLDIRDLSERSGAGEELQFGGSQESLLESLDADGAFNVSFPRVGESLSFLPARHYPQWEGGLLQPLSEDQIRDNKERDILEQAALSNATFVGRQHWNQFYLQYMMGRIPMNDSPDRYRETAGFALKQMVDPDTKAVRYERPEAAFNPWNRIRLKDLIDAVRKESQNKSRLDGKSQSVDNVKAHLEELLAWAKDISKRVSPTQDKDHAKFEKVIGGMQTLADRTRPLIESQFGNKENLEPFNPDGTPFDGNNEDNAEWETNGLIPLIKDTLIALDKVTTPAEAIKLLQGKKSVGGMMTRRLAGANDSVKLARKALKEFKDVKWRRNYEREASTVQRQEAFKPDNKELLELRDSPADIRVFSNLTFTLNYHENSNDYVVSPNFGFEMMRDYRRAFRGEGYIPEVYREVGNQKIYLGHRFDREIIERTGTHPDIPAYSKLEYDSDGIPFYFKQVSRNNFNENVTDRSIYGDDRGNRSQTLEGMTNELGEEQVLTAGANAINQAGSANASQRLWITHSAAIIGSQSYGRNSVDDGRQWFWDLQQMERGKLTRSQMEGVIRRGIQGIFPRAHAFSAKGREDFWNEMYNRLPSELTGDMRGSGMGIDGKETLLASELRPSAESVLVALGELKQSFEFELVEQAKAGYQTDRALQTVMDSLAGEREVTVKETKTIETPVANPKFNPEEDSPFSRTKTEPRTIIERKQIEQIRKELRFGASNNTLASPEESEAISNMLRKSLTFEGLAIYDAAMMVHGIDGLGSPTLSLAVQNLPGETLVVAPHEGVLNNFGLNDIGLRIFEGKNGNPNVVYVPQSQSKDELSPQEVFSGLAHTLIISANSNEQIKEELTATAKAIRETLEPAIYIQGQMDKWQNHVDTFTRRLEPQTAKLTPAGKRKFRNQVADHLVKLGVLADSLGINQRSANLVSIFPGQDPSLVSDAMLVAELFSNRDAKTLFDEAFLGTDTYNESLLSTPVTDMLHSGIKFPTRPGQGGMYDEDAIANLSEVREELADDEDEFEEEEIEGDPNLNALDQALGSIRNSEQEEAFMSGDLSGGNAMPDARSINNALRKELRRLETVNDSLKAGNLQDNPSDAFLFNSMAAILQHGKAVQSPPMDYRVKRDDFRGKGEQSLRANGERSARNILMGHHTSDERVKAVGGPIMEGRPGGSSKATNIYVGEIRNLTIPKARGATAQRIGFNHRNIQNTSAALTLLAPSVNGAVEEAVRERAGSGLGSAGMRHLGRVEVPVKLTRMVMDDLAESLPEAFILESEKEVRDHMTQLDANLVKLEKQKTAFEKHLKGLRAKPVTADRIESQKRAENFLLGINKELDETVAALRLADQHTGIELVGIGYWKGMVGSPAQTEPSGRIIRPEVEPHEVNASAIITFMDPSLELDPKGIVTNASLLAREDPSKALERREHYIMKQALVNALNGYARDHVSDQYKLVRNTDDNFLHFDPLKAINRSVKMVRVEDEIMKRLVDEARDDASEANLAGMTAEALAVLTSPNTPEAQEVYINEQGKLRLVSMPKNFMERKDKLGQLVSQDGQKVMLLPKNARDELMRAFPQTFTKRNINRELSNLVLNAKPITPAAGQPGSYSYFLGSSEKQESESFASDDFSLTKGTPMTKGEAAKKFVTAWQDGMQEFLNAAMNNGQGTNKSLDLTGNLSKRQIHQFGYMLERLVIAHGDPRLSAKTRKKLNATLDMISEGQISKIGLIGSMPVVDPTRMQQLRIEPLLSKVFSEIEAEEIQKRLIAGLFIVDGKENAIETGVMKYFHHQDARIRNRFRKDYVARQTAMHLNGFLNYGVDGKSGRRGYETAKKEIENSIADKARKVGPDALNHTIGYLSAVLNGTGQSFGRSRVSSLNWLIKELSGGFIQLEELDNAQDQHFKTKDANGKRRLRGEANRYWNANHIDLLRDTELALKMRDILKESGLSSQFITDEQEAKDLIDHTIKVLESHITDGKVNEVRAYAQEIEKQFSDIHAAMQFTMAMLSREEAPDEEKTGESWKDSKRDAFRATYSSVPLRIGYASHPDPKERSVSSGKFISDPADIVSFKDSSFFGGYGKQNDFNNRNKSVFRPIQINGLTAPLSLVDDAVYRLNVTPTYDVLRRAIGRSSSDSHGKTLVRDGDFLEKVQSLRPENDNGTRQWREGYEQAIKKEEMFQEALSGISSELETVIQNDAANGVLNTGGAEVMRFLGSAYIVRSLASIQQLWDQTTGPSVGYSLGKLSVGKGYQVGDYFHILGKLLTDKDFRENARKFIREVDPSVYYRSADGADITQSVMKSQRRYGANVAKNKVGKALRKYEEIGEQALHFTIGGGERFIATSMFLTEMMDQMGGITVEELIAKKDEEIPISAKINSKLKVSDVMAQSDQSTKSWMFQNRTSGPARAALWKSLVRFSNHTSSVASNTAVMTPVLFDSSADPQTKLEARENVVTSLAQNLLFYPFKLKTLIPMVAYLLYGLGGDDDDEAQKKAQELANNVMAVDKDSNPLAKILKTLMFGKKREFFQQDKKADAAQASAVAELLSKSAAELATTIPVLGVLAGYSPVSGALQKSITNPLSVEAAAGMNNLVNKRQLKTSNSSFNNNAVSIRSYQDSWGEAIASASAPTEMAYAMGQAAALLTQYNMTRHAKGDRIGSFLDSLLYAATEFVPFAREARAQTKSELQAIIKKESKR